jgi:transcriptional regulator with XRE-family HTH domain
MPDSHADEAIGARIKRYRLDKKMSLSQLAREANISKGYLWALENPPEGEHQQRPSGETLYAIASALGVAMSDLLGRRLIIQPDTGVDPSLEAFADQEGLSQADVTMLASIQWRGDPPRTSERWKYIYQAIVMSTSLDDKHN